MIAGRIAIRVVRASLGASDPVILAPEPRPRPGTSHAYRCRLPCGGARRGRIARRRLVAPASTDSPVPGPASVTVRAARAQPQRGARRRARRAGRRGRRLAGVPRDAGADALRAAGAATARRDDRPPLRASGGVPHRRGWAGVGAGRAARAHRLLVERAAGRTRWAVQPLLLRARAAEPGARAGLHDPWP